MGYRIASLRNIYCIYFSYIPWSPLIYFSNPFDDSSFDYETYVLVAKHPLELYCVLCFFFKMSTVPSTLICLSICSFLLVILPFATLFLNQWSKHFALFRCHVSCPMVAVLGCFRRAIGQTPAGYNVHRIFYLFVLSLSSRKRTESFVIFLTVSLRNF